MNSCKCCRWLRRSNWNPLKGTVKTKRVCSANKRDHIENPCNQIRVRVGWSATRRLFRFRSDKQGNARRVTVTVRVRVKIRDALRSRLWLHSQRKTAFASKASGWPQVHFSVSEGGYELSAIEDPYDDDSEEQPAEHCQNTEKKTECSSVGVWMHAKKNSQLVLSCRCFTPPPAKRRTSTHFHSHCNTRVVRKSTVTCCSHLFMECLCFNAIFEKSIIY